MLVLVPIGAAMLMEVLRHWRSEAQVAVAAVGSLAAAIEAPAPAHSEIQDEVIAKGKYLAEAGNCLSCHTRPGGDVLAGGRPFATMLGVIYSSNITPDPDTGIGTWTVQDFRRAMQTGISPNGRHLFPAFPYTSFTKVSDRDIDAIFAYLQAISPRRYTPPGNSFVFRQRWVMRFWNALFFEPGRFQVQPTKTDEWNRGAYLVEGLAHCGACHTPRNLFLAEITSRANSGGALLDRVADGKVRRWSAVNLTSAKSGLAAWSVSELSQYLQTGFSLRAGTFGPMNEVIVNSLNRLTREDVKAMAVYIKALPAQSSTDTAVPEALANTGAEIYEDRCEKCHIKSGRGGMFTGPPLAGSAVVQANDPASLINTILYGPELPLNVSFGAWETMQGYADILDDNQVASVSNYIRGSWNNSGAAVTAADVAKQR